MRQASIPIPFTGDDPGQIWLAKKPNMAEGSEVTWAEMRLAKLAPRSGVFRAKDTVSE